MKVFNLADKRLEQHRITMQEEHTAGLKFGWYVLTGFFWHDSCAVVAGPFSTQEDAMACRQALPDRERFYIDEAD